MSIGISSELLYAQMQKSKNDSKAIGLQNKLTGLDEANSSDEEIMEVCKEFEAYLVEKVFDRMKDAMTESEEEEGDYLSYFGDMMYQEYAKQIAENGELGLAQQLYESMKTNTITPVQASLQNGEAAEAVSTVVHEKENKEK